MIRTGTIRLRSDHGKAGYFGAVSVLILVFALNTVTTMRQAPWEDEIFAVSTAWSLSRSQAPILSVLAQYPNTKSPVRFYGPVSFEVEAFLIRVFGLSLIPWRLACSLGVFITMASCASLLKLAGGDKWSCLLAALFIALSSSVYLPFPGRWDAVTMGLFLWGLSAFLSTLEGTPKRPLIRLTVAGILIATSIASTPRALTLTVALAVAVALTGVLFPRLRKKLFAGLLYSLCVAVATHNLFLLPWGQNSVSWYAEVRKETKADFINATPIAGRGLWTLDLQHHRVMAIAILFFVSAVAASAIGRRSEPDTGRLPLKVLLSLFGVINVVLMLLLLANAFGQTNFLVPSIAVAGFCWMTWDNRGRSFKGVITVLLALCFLVLSVEEVEQAGSVILSWHQRSTEAFTNFVRKAIPAGAPVYGPIGDYFYAVELAGGQYLYPFEHTTPGLYSQPLQSVPDVGTKLDEMICSRPTYVIWPKPDLIQQPFEQSMPQALRDRLQSPIAEFDQPPLPEWKRWLLSRAGVIGGKYGFPSVILYSTTSVRCP